MTRKAELIKPVKPDKPVKPVKPVKPLKVGLLRKAVRLDKTKKAESEEQVRVRKLTKT
jgi:hypothetical protein